MVVRLGLDNRSDNDLRHGRVVPGFVLLKG
jgi:hypothetical protein